MTSVDTGGASLPPRAVIFDAGNTLLRIHYGAIAAHLRTRGHDVTVDRVREAEVRARVRLDPHLVPGASTESRATHARYLAYLLEHLGIADAAEVDAVYQWVRDYNQPLGFWTEPEPEADAALARVKAAGLVAGVVSNSNGTVRRLLEDARLAHHLDFVIDSSEVGVEKPDRRIFELALREAGVGPREAVYVGDLYSVDVLGARAAGLDAILLDPLGCWGERDCRRAPNVAEAVSLILGSAR